MNSAPNPSLLIRNGFILDAVPFPDAPLQDGDVVLYADRFTGRALIARAPILRPAEAQERNRSPRY
ncbi:MAG: hypothetical protein K1Y02_13290 [Candidatus Hydrogenedentes bacterium]|nr:hypothetical protein [Candidatus Hydrogenedentota bacterium]